MRRRREPRRASRSSSAKTPMHGSTAYRRNTSSTAPAAVGSKHRSGSSPRSDPARCAPSRKTAGMHNPLLPSILRTGPDRRAVAASTGMSPTSKPLERSEHPWMHNPIDAPQRAVQIGHHQLDRHTPLHQPTNHAERPRPRARACGQRRTSSQHPDGYHHDCCQFGRHATAIAGDLPCGGAQSAAVPDHGSLRARSVCWSLRRLSSADDERSGGTPAGGRSRCLRLRHSAPPVS